MKCDAMQCSAMQCSCLVSGCVIQRCNFFWNRRTSLFFDVISLLLSCFDGSIWEFQTIIYIMISMNDWGTLPMGSQGRRKKSIPCFALQYNAISRPLVYYYYSAISILFSLDPCARSYVETNLLLPTYNSHLKS